MKKSAISRRVLTFCALLTLILVSFTQILDGKAYPSPILSISRIAWNHDGSQVALGWGTDWCVTNHPEIYTVDIFDAQTHQIIQNLPGSTCDIGALDWSPDDTKLAAASLDSVGVRVWDVKNGRLLMTAQRGGQGVSDVKWRPDGNQLIVAGIGNGTALLDPATGEILPNMRMLVGGTSLDWSPDGNKLVTGSIYETSPQIADMTTRQPMMTLEDRPSAVGMVDWSPDGTRIAASGWIDDPHVWIWDAETGKKLLTLPVPSNAIRWSPDSQYLASANDDSTVLIWDGSTGQPAAQFRDSGRVYTVDWSPDGTKIVYGGESAQMCFISVPTISAATETPHQCELSPEELSKMEG